MTMFPLGGTLTPLGVTLATPNVLASVPWVAQWKFNNDGNDSIGSNHLTAVNSPAFVAGKINEATQLVRASSQYYSIADNADLSLGTDTDFLITFWIKLTSTLTGYPDVIVKASDLSPKYVEYSIQKTNNASSLNFNVGNGTSGATVTTGVLGTAWHLIVAWHDSTNNKICVSVDAGAATETAWSGGTQNTANAVYVGRNIYGTHHLDGLIDNMCIAKGSGAVPAQAVLNALWNSGNGTETLT